ncbi:hypothetical protein PSEUDO8Z_10022 [Pseudomonas sp. 8Z]|nr:hypothetical protein PSEUDO8Z_10022 [Pseudomonas sp. 8Z]
MSAGRGGAANLRQSLNTEQTGEQAVALVVLLRGGNGHICREEAEQTLEYCAVAAKAPPTVRAAAGGMLQSCSVRGGLFYRG